jgi:uracil-DNA glycosylase
VSQPGDIRSKIGDLAKEFSSVLEVLQERGATVLPGRLSELTPVEIPAVVSKQQATVALPPTDFGKEAKLDHLRKQAAECRRCRLATTRQSVVFGDGSSNSRVMFVGEGPGAREDETGHAFVGRAGQLLTKMLQAIGLERKDVYITNIVKCRPPRNRDPLPDEVAACRPFLDAQLATLKPAAIVALGRPSAHTLLKSDELLSKLRQTVHKFSNIPLLVTYHPAYLLRNPARKASAWEDLRLLADLMIRAKVHPPLPAPWWQ